MSDEIECKKCGEICVIDGEFPRYFAYCDFCHDYASGFDNEEYAANYIANLIDQEKDRRKYEDL